jgi:hypothetical protein
LNGWDQEKQKDTETAQERKETGRKPNGRNKETTRKKIKDSKNKPKQDISKKEKQRLAL